MICLNTRLDLAKERIRKQEDRYLENILMTQHRKIKEKDKIEEILRDIEDQIK